MAARFLVVALVALLCAVPAYAQDPGDDPFAGAAACQPCHAEIHAAWAKTKHQRAFQMLGAADRTRAECIGCHITALPAAVEAQAANPRHPGVGCEACHGPGKGHIAQQPALAGLTAAPGERICLQCHNERSPTYKGFFYAGMKAFVHKP